MRLRVAVFLLAFSCSVASADPEAVYRLDLTVDLDESRLEGEGTLRVRNTGAEPLKTLPLVLYPARFRTLDPSITDVNFDRFYVRWFDAGDMRLRRVRLGGVELPVSPGSELMPPGTSVSVLLPEPVAPGAWVELELAFEVEIPDRLGSFGQRGDRVILDGGAIPYVPARNRKGLPDPRGSPVPARYDLALAVRGSDDPGALIGTRAVGTERVIYEGGSPFLAVGDDLTLLFDSSQEKSLGVRVYGSEGDEERAETLDRIGREAAGFFRRKFLPEGTRLDPLTLVEAPLRDRFVDVADGVVLYSNRLLRVFFLLRQFHELEFGRAVILSLTRQVLADVPLGADRNWICEGVAWMAAQEWVNATKTGIDGADVRRGIEVLSFIPVFDDLMKSPRFPGSDLFYGRFYEPADVFPDGFSRALSRRQRGRVVFEKLRDKLGDKSVLGFVRKVLGGQVDPRTGAAELAGEDLSAFFDLWLGPLPRQNLSFGTIEKDGDDLLVEVVREGDPRIGEVGEPVDLELDGDEPIRVRWPGRGMRGKVRIPAGGGYWLPTIDLDPDRRTHQTKHADDTTPRVPVKILVNRFSISIDLNGGNRNEGALGVTLHPGHDYSHKFTVDAFYEQDESGVDVGYAYGFGTKLDARTYGASVGAGFTAANLNEGVLDSDETEGTLVSLNAGGVFDTRVNSANPTWGFRISGNMEYADELFDSEFRFRLYRGAVGAVYSIVRGTQVGVDVKLGQIDGSGVPSQRLFDVGGSSTVRGVQSSKIVDNALFVVRSEVRHMLVEDLDLSILWLSWLRKIQLVGFLDIGDVGPSIEHIVRRDTFWKWGTGGGVRLFLDAFGVKGIVVRFSIGTRLFEDGNQSPQYYLGVNQSF